MASDHTPSVQQMLATSGLKPKKALGQNFLVDQNHLLKIVAAAEIEPGSVILEVGPGTGVLTSRLLEAGARVVAVEFDRDLEPLLRDRFDDSGDRFRLIIGDALEGKHGLNAEMVDAIGGQSFSLVANLPYQIASPLLINLAIQTPSMRAAVVMIQKEVADRILAAPGSKTYGVLGVLLQVVFEIERISKVPPGCFFPPPKIDSSVVRLIRREKPLVDDLEGFGAMLHKLFSQRRKQIGSVLGRDTALPAEINARQRPEQLSVDLLVALHHLMLDQTANEG